MWNAEVLQRLNAGNTMEEWLESSLTETRSAKAFISLSSGLDQAR